MIEPLTKLPKTLYKYRGFDEYSGDILVNNNLYFSHPSSFNDPFDCNIPFQPFTIEEAKYRLIYQADPSSIGLDRTSSIEERTRVVEERFPNCLSNEEQEKYLDLARNSARIRNLKIAGILCLSANYSNILMWSHYSKNHEGFVLGFRTEKLWFSLGELYGAAIDKIDYKKKEEYPEIKITDGDDKKKMMLQAFTKSIDWEYEEEYRMVNFKHGQRSYEFIPSVLKEIRLGCKMPQSQKKIITDWLKLRDSKYNSLKYFKPKLYEAKMSNNIFGLEFDPIEY